MNTPFTKTEVQNALEQAFETIIDFIHNQRDVLFEQSESEGKWTTGQQLEHLIKSVAPITKALLLPKIAIKLRFGTIKRDEMTYEELVNLYKVKLEEGAVASKPYIPEQVSLSRKSILLDRYQSEKKNLVNRIGSWNEKDLSSIAALHPVLGYLSIRELMFFTIYHNYHHLESLKKIS